MLCLLLAGCGPAGAPEPIDHALIWDANPEGDMAEYRVYQCLASPCRPFGEPYAVLAHQPGQEHRVIIPNLDTVYVVVAVNQAGLVSDPSVEVHHANH